jgi:hypothetical protein
MERGGAAGHPGHSAQAGRPHLYLIPLALSSSDKSLIQLFVRVLELLVQNIQKHCFLLRAFIHPSKSILSPIKVYTPVIFVCLATSSKPRIYL